MSTTLSIFSARLRTQWTLSLATRNSPEAGTSCTPQAVAASDTVRTPHHAYIHEIKKTRVRGAESVHNGSNVMQRVSAHSEENCKSGVQVTEEASVAAATVDNVLRHSALPKPVQIEVLQRSGAHLAGAYQRTGAPALNTPADSHRSVPKLSSVTCNVYHCRLATTASEFCPCTRKKTKEKNDLHKSTKCIQIKTTQDNAHESTN
jgi:hypothetical protein